MSTSKEDRKHLKESWEERSTLARAVTSRLAIQGYLKTPPDRLGWGLATWLKVWVAREIDDILDSWGTNE